MPGDVPCLGLWQCFCQVLQPTQASLVGLHHQAQPDPMGTPQKADGSGEEKQDDSVTLNLLWERTQSQEVPDSAPQTASWDSEQVPHCH